jgi:hypothetical protein
MPPTCCLLLRPWWPRDVGTSPEETATPMTKDDKPATLRRRELRLGWRTSAPSNGVRRRRVPSLVMTIRELGDAQEVSYRAMRTEQVVSWTTRGRESLSCKQDVARGAKVVSLVRRSVGQQRQYHRSNFAFLHAMLQVIGPAAFVDAARYVRTRLLSGDMLKAPSKGWG